MAKVRSAFRLQHLAIAYLFGLILIWIVGRYAGESNWIVLQLTYIPAVYYALPMLILLPLSLARCSKYSLIVLMTAALVLAFPLAGLHIAVPNRLPSDIRVMTLNIEAETRGTQGILRLVRQQAPDIICLQEATQNIWKDDSPPTPALMNGLESAYHTRRFGHLLLASRWPVKRIHTTQLEGAPTQRPLLAAAVECPFGNVTVLTTHLMPVSWTKDYTRRRWYSSSEMIEAARLRRSQIRRILAVCNQTSGPLIVAGDLNMPARGLLYSRLASSMTDAFASTGLGTGYTCPANTPLRRIDHIYARGLTPVRAFVPTSAVSDHRAVVADLAWRKP